MCATWKLADFLPSFTRGLVEGLGGGAGPALLGFFGGFGRVGGGSFLSRGAPSVSGMGGKVGGPPDTWKSGSGKGMGVIKDL